MLQCVRLFNLALDSFALVRRVMVRKGWTHVDVPSGWVLARCMSSRRGSHSQTGPSRESDSSREAARLKVVKLGVALEVTEGSESPRCRLSESGVGESAECGEEETDQCGGEEPRNSSSGPRSSSN